MSRFSIDLLPRFAVWLWPVIPAAEIRLHRHGPGVETAVLAGLPGMASVSKRSVDSNIIGVRDYFSTNLNINATLSVKHRSHAARIKPK
jgi:hypothetical protein